MSKTSHTKHEHKEHTHIKSANEVPDEDFSKHHKLLIWVFAIALVVILPLVFAALTVLRMINW